MLLPFWVNDMNTSELVLFEGMVSVSAVLNSSLNERKIKKVLFDEDKKKQKKRQLDYLLAMSEKHGFEIEYVTSDYLDSITQGKTHGGVAAYCADRKIPTITPDIIKDGGFYVYVDGIEDPFNFGYTLRSIYAAGADGAVLPPRNWMSASSTVCRSSAGASEKMPLFTSCDEMYDMFKERKYKIVCAGIRNSVSAYDADLKKPLLLVVGGEKRGISSSVLQRADSIVRLEYGREFMQSLSASSAATVLAFEVLRQNL